MGSETFEHPVESVVVRVYVPALEITKLSAPEGLPLH